MVDEPIIPQMNVAGRSMEDAIWLRFEEIYCCWPIPRNFMFSKFFQQKYLFNINILLFKRNQNELLNKILI